MTAVASSRDPSVLYEVQRGPDGWRCTCPGYQYRKTCKHIKEAEMSEQPAPQATLYDIYEALTAPFDPSQVELKPGATTQDKNKALCLAYVDARAYQQRLDEVVGPDGWQVAYRPLGERAVICRLQIFGVVREEVGETADPKDPNAWTGATAQSFKRACASFGIGRYLYSLPQPWAPYDGDRRQIKDPQQVIAQIYRQAGIAA